MNKKIKSKKKLMTRPPVVAVLGHIDHGKTSILSKIRQSDLTAQESGGITQHTGAYQINFKGQKITFLDTPGHAAFAKMRSRGADVADLVVLVVAADEGFKPQTKESLDHIQAAKIPYLVALNKIDLPNLDLEKIKENLAKNNLPIEGHGGEVVVVPVSAKTGQGIDDLLEMILLLAEMAEIKADPRGDLEAVVIESELDRAQGPLATVLVRNGCLKLGQKAQVEGVEAKIKAIFDEKGERIKEALPGQPVVVLGFKAVPRVGGSVKAAGNKIFVDSKISSVLLKSPKTEKEKSFKIILKADTAGTLEAIRGSLPPEVELVSDGVGDLNETEIFLADSAGAKIYGFRIKSSSSIKKLAENEAVEFETFSTIYELLEKLEEDALTYLEPDLKTPVLGRAEIIAEFGEKKSRIAGVRVLEGEINKKDRLLLKRGEKTIGQVKIKSMKQGKENISLSKKGEEFGVILRPNLDFEIGDMLVSTHSQPAPKN